MYQWIVRVFIPKIVYSPMSGSPDPQTTSITTARSYVALVQAVRCYDDTVVAQFVYAAIIHN